MAGWAWGTERVPRTASGNHAVEVVDGEVEIAQVPDVRPKVVARRVDQAGRISILKATRWPNESGGAVGALGAGIANYVTLLDPDRVIVGGGVSRAGPRLFVPLRQTVGDVLPPFAKAPAILPAALGPQAGCVGAGILAWSRAGGTVSTAR